MFALWHCLFMSCLNVAFGALKTKNSSEVGKTFVHLFEWSWNDVANECEQWLGPKGYAAVQISPPNEHSVDNSWSARYKPVSYNLTSRSGTEEELATMIQRCNAAGVAVYADVVVNQMAPYSGVGIAGSHYGQRTYPLFGPEDFHHLDGDLATNCGVDNYQNERNVQYCDLLGMPDLCTGCSHVQDVIANYIAKMEDLGIKGFRIDAAKHIASKDLQGLFTKVDPSLFRFLEVLKAGGEAVHPQEYFALGKVTEIGYGHTLSQKFQSDGKLWGDLESLGEVWGLMAANEAIVFIDNHDTQRNDAVLTYKNGDVYALANVYMLAWPYGYPKVMSSYRFADTDQGPPTVPVYGNAGGSNCGSDKPWVCEHRWPSMANMVAWRKTAGDLPVTEFAVASGDAYGNGLSFCRGSVACVVFNRNPTSDWQAEVKVSLPAGMYCNVLDASSECAKMEVADDGTLKFQIAPVSAVALHIGKQA